MAATDYGFIQFSDTLDDCNCVHHLSVSALSELKFYLYGLTGATMYLCTLSGEHLHSDGSLTTSDWFGWNYDLSTIMACRDCFRISLVYNDVTLYSNVVMYDNDTENTLLVKYSCDQPAFGIEYDGDKYSQIRLPAILDEANYKKDESLYTDSNGKIRVLYRDIRKKYQLKIDYLPEWMHDNVAIVLAHDHVYIDGVEMDIDGDYAIDWDNLDDSGCVELIMGECTMQENFVKRNSNC